MQNGCRAKAAKGAKRGEGRAAGEAGKWPSKRLFKGFASEDCLTVQKGRMVEVENERELISASRAGDPAAFEALVRCHQRMIYSLTYRMSGSPADAEDLAQETFIQAWQQLAGFRSEAAFSSWLCRIAANLCLNWRKRETRREQIHRSWAEERESEASANAFAVQRVQEALLKLPPKQRVAVILTVCDGLSHQQAAQVLGCSETTVSWRLFAARRKLKRLLKSIQSSGGGQ